MIKIGCTGFPVATKKYQSLFRVVEATAFMTKAPRLNTLEKWRSAAPSDFEFILCAPLFHAARKQLFNAKAAHERKRHEFHYRSLNSQQLFHGLLNAARILKSNLISFHMPASFSPTADNIRRLQDMFLRSPREEFSFVWDPPASWPASLIKDLSKNLNLIPAANPLAPTPLPAHFPLQYYRLGSKMGMKGVYSFSDPDLNHIRSLCKSKPSYVIFNNGPYAYPDASRFLALTKS